MKARAIHLLLISITLGYSLSVALCESSLAKDKELTPEEVVTAHQESIGSLELLERVENRGMSGGTSVEFLQGGFGTLAGQCMVVTSGPNLSIILRYGAADYPGEYFAYDGTDVEVATISPGQRSPLGDFIFRYKGLMKEGLLGGVWSLGWPLLDIEKRNPSLKYIGTKKIEGRELHGIEYTPEGGLNNIKVKLFFEPDTFRHVRTEYALRVQGEQALQFGKTVTRGITDSTNLARGQASGPITRDAGILDQIGDSYYLLVEKFDNFKEVKLQDLGGNGIMSLILPQSYALEYSVEGQGSSFLANWNLVADQWMQNGKLDPSVFKVH